MPPKNQLKTTSKDVASAAGKLLSGPATSDEVRSVAGSALAQSVPETDTQTMKSAKAKKGRPVSSFKAGKDL